MKYYVYALIDPRSRKAFYIGKGCGNRAYQHLKQASFKNPPNTLVASRIIEIRKHGMEAAVRILRKGLTETEALRLERILIKRLKKNLVNILNGSVDSLTHSKNRATLMLSRLKSYEDWLIRCPDKVRIVEESYGSPREFYDYLIGALRFIQMHGAVEYYSHDEGVVYG